MKIHWSDIAIEMLKEIYNYYKQKAGPVIANKIMTDELGHTKLDK